MATSISGGCAGLELLDWRVPGILARVVAAVANFRHAPARAGENSFSAAQIKHRDPTKHMVQQGFYTARCRCALAGLLAAKCHNMSQKDNQISVRD